MGSITSAAESHWIVQLSAIVSIIALGLINYIGPKRAGTFALVVAMATLVLSLIIVIFAIPHLPAGFHAIQRPVGTPVAKWSTLVNVVLALSGVEAIANMTGIMVLPVSRTSKKSIWPVLLEVVIFNVIFGIAMLALPSVMQTKHGVESSTEFTQPAANYLDHDKAIDNYLVSHPNAANTAEFGKVVATNSPHSSESEDAIKNKVMRVMAVNFVHPVFGWIAGIVFGLLLLSAVTTVFGGMISVCYVMSRDNELPQFF